MFDNATVTLSLSEFDELRKDGEAYRKIAKRIAACFEYKCTEFNEPEQCKTCKKKNPICEKCKVYKENSPWEEFLEVDVERLINAAKQCALYGKDLSKEIGIGDINEMRVVKTESGADE